MRQSIMVARDAWRLWVGSVAIAAVGCGGEGGMGFSVGLYTESFDGAEGGSSPPDTSTGAPAATDDGQDSTSAPPPEPGTGDTTDGSDESSTSDGSTSDPTTGDASSSSSSDATTGEPTCGNGALDVGENCDGDQLAGQDCASQGFDTGTLACADDCSSFDTSGCSLFVCGNGILEGDESCDEAALAGQSCVTLGFDAGTLACDGSCAFDTSQCIDEVCGDSIVQAPEQCDGGDLDGATCISQGYAFGVLACNGDCTYDESGCGSFACGNGLVEGTEACDDANLLGQTCISLGYDAGALACLGDCSALDTSGCTSFSCGNGIIEGAEACDGANLGGETCTSLGHDTGTLACDGTCTFDDSDCQDFAGSCCSAHQGVGCDDPACVAAVCNVSSFCCDAQWDALCAALAFNQCPAVCDNCGDGTINGPNELCDGSDVGGETCASVGFDGGTLACAADCTAIDTSGCYDYGGNCCVADATPGCDDDACTASVCASMPSCCTTAWTAACATAALSACPIVCNACVEQNIGSGVGNSVASGSIVGEDSAFTQTCSPIDGVERVLQWTAPSAGVYTFDLVGSSYDTLISIYDNCDANTLLACNDDFAGNPLCGGYPCSETQVSLAAGQDVMIAISGYNGAVGSYVLNIQGP